MKGIREKEFKRKRFLSFIIVLGYLFFGGCEYVGILPTVWDYLQTLGATDEKWLGFTLSAYSLMAAIAGVIVGRITDKYYQHTKLIVAVSISFRIIGNFLYMLGLNKWNLLVARALCGIGSASGTALLAEVCRTTSVAERTRFLSICNAVFQMGIMIGPGLQIILSYFDFNILGLNVNTLNSPGMFLGVLWVVFFIGTVFLFDNLTDEFRDIQEKKREESLGGKLLVLEVLTETVDSDCEVRKANKEQAPRAKENRGIYKMYMDEFLTKSFVLLMSLVYSVYFCQISFETVIPVITRDNFGFGVNENSFVYMAGGLEALVTFVGIALIGKRVRETTLQIVGWFLMVVAQVWLLIFMPNFEKGNQAHMVYFLIGIFLIYLGSPIATVGNTALSSKVLSNDTQGLGQGIRRLVTYMSLIFGPIWAGWTVQKPYLFVGATLALMLLNGVMLVASYRSLREAEEKTLESSRHDKSER